MIRLLSCIFSLPLILTLHAPVFVLSVRTAAGTSTKSSLFHTWTRDTRDHPILGTRGVRAQLRHELAGLGCGASFYKAEGSLHASRVLLPGLVS
jgi:outer membrane protein insertion porin family